MEMNESVAQVAASQKTKCVICSKNHEDPKKETITETAGKSGWKRVSMNSKFEQTGEKLAIYPKNRFPPPYMHEGHHNLALSAFVANEKTNPTDVRLRLNYFLNKIGYSPNRDQNSIGLPGRPLYDAFWEALDAAKPLQMHIGDHDDSFMSETAALLGRLVHLLTDPDLCEETDQAAWEGALMDAITCAENYAFRKLASNAAPWRLHPVDHDIALEAYFMPSSQQKTFVRKSGKVTLKGRGNPQRKVSWPDPKLECGPFA